MHKKQIMLIQRLIMLYIELFNNVKGLQHVLGTLRTYHFHSVLKKRRRLTSFRATINWFSCDASLITEHLSSQPCASNTSWQLKVKVDENRKHKKI